MQAMDIRRLPVESLIPATYNPRKDLKPGDPEYEKLLRSVDDFGFVQPIIWNERTKRIVGGHQRLKVLQQLGYTEVECVVVDMEEYREMSLNVALNKVSGEWDLPKLHDVIAQVQASGIDPTVTGFDLKEVDKMFQEYQLAATGVAEDNFDAEGEAEKIKEPVTQLGDVWLIGRHRLMCGDSTDIQAVETLMAGKKAKFVFTDPPWNVDYGGQEHPSWKRRSILNDKMSKKDFYDFLVKVIKSMWFGFSVQITEHLRFPMLIISARFWI